MIILRKIIYSWIFILIQVEDEEFNEKWMTLLINALLDPSQYFSLQVYALIDSAHCINNSLYSVTN